MSLWEIFLLAVALGTDSFSLCVGLGMGKIKRKEIIALSLTVLVYHIVMPILGWFAGDLTGRFLGKVATYIGGAILIYLGYKMIRHGISQEEELPHITYNLGGLLLIGLSVSMDALSVGFTLGTVKVNLWFVALITGIVAGVMTLSGLLLGRRVSKVLGDRAQIVGGLILLLIAGKLIFRG
ncbi:manganese efflux pump MntP [Carboxydothermus ferrireducens]|uniref:Putative manganese efflux pump MntP n=1 Tax=Carboxydothermus ferrireducens DSM 11255 TaxID=1119529 RepID=A0ABX2R954_9THEO|nr:manganese efflux pump MntP family protein [Carboxydothermus ferrireducens]NYE57704.1 putative Mn2+ efflux pump MntP [Carboxydothermus ferrireducens DSM 11255]